MKLMKFAMLAFACVFCLNLTAQENLLKGKFKLRGQGMSETPDGVIHCKFVEGDKWALGGKQTIFLNQTKPTKIVFSAESKAENVSGKTHGNYCVYLDIQYTDNTFKFGRIAAFKPGTHDWEKAESSFMPEKPIKLINYCLVFRKIPGSVSFRNAKLSEVK